MPIIKALADMRKMTYHLWYTYVGGMVPKCVICEGGSILRVQFFAKKISLYMVRWDLENFHL